MSYYFPTKEKTKKPKGLYLGRIYTCPICKKNFYASNIERRVYKTKEQKTPICNYTCYQKYLNERERGIKKRSEARANNSKQAQHKRANKETTLKMMREGATRQDVADALGCKLNTVYVYTKELKDEGLL